MTAASMDQRVPILHITQPPSPIFKNLFIVNISGIVLKIDGYQF